MRERERVGLEIQRDRGSQRETEMDIESQRESDNEKKNPVALLCWKGNAKQN